MPDILEQICNDKKSHVAQRKAACPETELRARIRDTEPPRGFLNSLKAATHQGRPALIAEIKKASPSKGVIRADFDPVKIGAAYETGGASALSILTDMPYFQGQDHYLADVKQQVALPVLRKDFMIDPYQILESRVLGADCILLIMAAVDDNLAQDILESADKFGMDVLVEVHDEAELERAKNLAPAMIGVNNRNLKTLKIDLNISNELVKHIPANVFKVAESGIYTHDDLLSFKNVGYQGFLVGESLMREDNILLATKKLLGTN